MGIGLLVDLRGLGRRLAVQNVNQERVIVLV